MMTLVGYNKEEFQWHVGETFPKTLQRPVRSLSADGQELTLLLMYLRFFGGHAPRPASEQTGFRAGTPVPAAIPAHGQSAVPVTGIAAETAGRTGEYAPFPDPPPLELQAIQQSLSGLWDAHNDAIKAIQHMKVSVKELERRISEKS